MKVLQEGMKKNPRVKQWQFFLIGQGITVEGGADGDFGANTAEATREFQRRSGVPPTGKVDNPTLAAAMTRGFVVVDDADDEDTSGPNFPPPPDFNPLPNNAARQAKFGPLEFVAAPVPGNPENIRITGTWEQDNLVMLTIPQLAGISIPGAGVSSGRARFHRKAATQFVALWAAWETAGLKDRVLTWGGSFMPRFIRGLAGSESLSVHAFGCAFDINMAQNALGAEPARVGQPGSVRELVRIANDHGFYWGGHFSRRDGMHFEVAQLR